MCLQAVVACSTTQAPLDVPRATGFAVVGDGARIYYERIGTGPAVALVHGLGGNHAVWYKQVPRFACDHTAIVYSQRGFAPSRDTAERGFDTAVLVDDLLGVLDAAGIERAHVIGQSMGGWTALGIALSHPERVASVVLADTTAGIFDAEIRSHYESTIERARTLGEQPPPMAHHPALGASFSRAHPDDAYLYQTLSAFGSPPPVSVAGSLGKAEFSRESLRALRVPVLFVVGENDKIFPPTIIRRAASYLAGARMAVVDGAGHSPYFEQPQRWHDVVRGFIERHDQPHASLADGEPRERSGARWRRPVGRNCGYGQ